MRRPVVEEFASPNVTPMIDVMLVLLIVFMVLVIRLHRTIDVQLPQSASAGPATTEIVLEVQPGPAYRINQRPVAAAALARRLAEIYDNRPDKILQVAGSPEATYREVAEAMDVARAAGVKVIGVQPRQ